MAEDLALSRAAQERARVAPKRFRWRYLTAANPVGSSTALCC